MALFTAPGMMAKAEPSASNNLHKVPQEFCATSCIVLTSTYENHLDPLISPPCLSLGPCR